MSREDYIFAEHALSAVLEAQKRALLEEIDAVDAGRLLNTGVDEWVEYFVDKFQIGVPRLEESSITVDQSEEQVDVSRDPSRFPRDRSRPFYLRGTRVSFFVPFDGDGNLFKCQPSTYTLNPPRASIGQGELILSYTQLQHDAAVVRSQFDRDLAEIREHLACIGRDVSPFNASIAEIAKKRIETRREKLLKDQNLATAMGFPLKRRSDAPQTYVVPTARRKMMARRPLEGRAPAPPEPALAMEEYEHILSVISNMVTVIERSPKAFSGMREEDIRQHFLVQLNAQYEGQATGETFNFEGKTDILIRVEGKNIFIAECKFWRGSESFREAIDQLLSYATWRDTKTTLIIFNRERKLSEVLAKIPEVIKAHPNFLRELLYRSETGFRAVVHHRDDKAREVILTILVFEVPA